MMDGEESNEFHLGNCHTQCLDILQQVYTIILKQDDYYPLNLPAPPESKEFFRNDDSLEEIVAHLPKILKKIQTVWLDSECEGSHSSGDWAMERLMELFIKYIGLGKKLDPSSYTKLIEFLRDIRENGYMKKYPDFLMNNLSLMLTEVILKSPNISKMPEELPFLAFSFIRSPTEYAMLSKGHRFDILFKCFTRFMDQQMCLEMLEGVNYDAEMALAFAVACPQNYTRKSASSYLSSLVLFAFDGQNVEGSLIKHQEYLKTLINALFKEFSSHLVSKAQKKVKTLIQIYQHSDNDAYGEVIINFCRLFSNLCLLSSNFMTDISEQQDVCGNFIEMMRNVVEDILSGNTEADVHELISPFAKTMVLLIKAEKQRMAPMSLSDSSVLHTNKLLEMLALFSEIENVSTAVELISIATELSDSGLFEPDVIRKLLDLSLLPVMVIVGATQSNIHAWQGLTTFVTKSLFQVDTQKCVTLVRVSVKNAFSVLKKLPSLCESIGYQHQDKIEPLLKYILLKTLTAPTQALKPWNGWVSSSEHVALLCCVLQEYQTNTDNQVMMESTDNSICVQTVCKSLFEHSDLTYSQMDCISQVYVESLKYMLQQSTLTDDEISRSLDMLRVILARLNINVKNADSRVREVAVRTIGSIYLLEMKQTSAAVHEMLAECGSLTQLWQSLHDSDEDVVTQALSVMQKAAQCKSLSGILDAALKTQKCLEVLAAELLCCRRWDAIKPGAFTLLTRLTRRAESVKYAAVCRQLDNSALSIAVMEHCGGVILPLLDDDTLSVAERLSSLHSWLLEGWGDIVLSKADDQDISVLRVASSVLTQVQNFVTKFEVVAFILRRIDDISSNTSLTSGACDLKDFQDSFADILRGWALSKDDPGWLKEPAFKKCKLSEPDRTNFFVRILAPSLKKISMLKESCPPRSEDFLDSTKQLSEVTVNSEDLPLKAITSMMCMELAKTVQMPEDFLMDINLVLTFTMYSKVLHTLKPQDLHATALISIDEYERSPADLVTDLENVIDKSFRDSSELLLKQTIELLVNKILVLDVCWKNSEKPLMKLMEELSLVEALTSFILDSHDDLMMFLMKQRRVLLKKTADQGKELIVDTFVNSYHQSHCDSEKEIMHFESQEGLGKLLYFYAEKKLKDPSADLLRIPELTNESLKVNSLSTQPNVKIPEEISKHQKLSIFIREQKATAESTDCIMSMAPWMVQIWCNTFLTTSDLKTSDKLKDELEQLITKFDFFPKSNSPEVVQFLKCIAQQMFLAMCGCAQAMEQLPDTNTSQLSALIEKVYNWVTTELDDFDSDGDIDPTAIDCF